MRKWYCRRFSSSVYVDDLDRSIEIFLALHKNVTHVSLSFDPRIMWVYLVFEADT